MRPENVRPRVDPEVFPVWQFSQTKWPSEEVTMSTNKARVLWRRGEVTSENNEAVGSVVVKTLREYTCQSLGTEESLVLKREPKVACEISVTSPCGHHEVPALRAKSLYLKCSR